MYKDHLPHGVSACRFLLTALCILLFAGNLRAAGDEEYMRKKISVQATNESIEQVLDKISKLAPILLQLLGSGFLQKNHGKH